MIEQNARNEEDKHREYLAYLCDRVQKITQAIYRVTDILSDQEPLKWKMRNESVSILEHLTPIKEKNFFEKTYILEESKSLIDKMTVLLSLFPCGQTLSSANFEILQNEYMAIKKIIIEEKKNDSLKNIFFDNGMKTIVASNGQNLVGQNNRHYNGQKEMVDISSNSSKIISRKNITITDRQNRKKRILEVVKEKERVTVGELSALFTEYSEKTLQRDLLEMVKGGILKKEGDKRWRTYLFNKPAVES